MTQWIFLNHQQESAPKPYLLEELCKSAEGPAFLNAVKKEESLKNIFISLGLEEKDLFFLTLGKNESDFQLLFHHYLDVVRETGKTHVLALETEHPAFLQSLKRLERCEIQGKILPVNRCCQLTRQTLETALKPRSSLLSLSYADQMTGVIQPLHEIAALCQEKEVRLHVDISAALGKLHIDFRQMPVDYLTFDLAALGMPIAMGGLAAKAALNLPKEAFNQTDAPFVHFSLLERALETANEKLGHYALETSRLRDFFEEGITQEVEGAEVLFQEVERLPHYSVIAFPRVHAELLALHLEKQGLFVSTGEGRLSSILKMCQVPSQKAYSALSFALSYETTQEDIERSIELIATAMKKLGRLGVLLNEPA